jgi:hypothetical protein
MSAVIAVPQQDGEIVVTTPGRSRIVLPVQDGRVTAHDDDTARTVLLGVPGAYPVAGGQAPDIDVDHATIAEVNAFLDQHPDRAATVLAVEAEGRNRKGVVEGPHAPAADPDDETDPADEPPQED